MKNIALPLCTIFVILVYTNSIKAQNITANIRLYWAKAGQELQFLVENTNRDTVKYTIKYAKGNVFSNLKTGAVASVNNKVTIPFSTTEAGFYRCEAVVGDTIATTVAIDPFNIQPIENEPADFDAYWQNKKKQLQTIPLSTNFSLETSTDYADIYNFNIDITDGRKAYGYFCVPKNLNGAKVPAIIELPAYGHVPNIINTDASMAERGGVLYIKLNIHNNPPTAAGPPEYITTHIADPNNYYLKYAMQGVIKTIDYLQMNRSQIDFNGQVGVMGMSQGGGLAMLAAGIDTRISLLLAMYPALCEHSGAKYGKPSGFPYYFRNQGDSAFPTVQYYDAVNTLKRFKGQAWIALAYNDVISPPATVTAAFNQIQGKKILQHEIMKEHLFGVDEFFDTNLPLSIYALIRQYFPSAKSPWPYNPTTTAYEIDAGNRIVNKAANSVSLSGKIKLNGVVNTTFPVFWEKISGAGTVQFSNPRSRVTAVQFSQPGVYRLRFIVQDTTALAKDSKFFQIVDEITIHVNNTFLLPFESLEKSAIEIDSNNLASNMPNNRQKNSLLQKNNPIRNIEVYPNPTQNEFFIANIEAPVLIEVYDMLGHLCLSKTHQDALAPLSMAHLANGVYTVFIKNQTNVLRRCILKQG